MAIKISALPVGSTPASTDIVGAGVQGGATVSFTAAAIAAFLATATLPAGTITTSQPLTLTQTWSAGAVAFTALKISVTDSASAAASLLMDLQVGGSSKVTITKAGAMIIGTGSGAGDLGFRLASSGFWTTGNSLGVGLASSYSPLFFDYPNGSTNFHGGVPIGFAAGIPDGGAIDTIVTRKAAANLQLGNFDAAAPVAQTLGVQSVVAGTSNTAGVDWTLAGSRGTGTGAAGNIVLQTSSSGSTGSSQNALATVATFGPSSLTGSQTTPVLTLAQTWNTSGIATAIALNVTDTASAAGSLLADFRVGGLSQFSIFKNTKIQFGNSNAPYLYQSGNNVLVFGTTGIGDIMSWGYSAGDVFWTFRSSTITTHGTSGDVCLGSSDNGAPVAQTLNVQSVAAGTSNTPGALFTVAGSQGTGTGVGGDIAFKTAPAGTTGTSQNSLAEVMRILAAGNIKYTNAANFSANGSVATSLGSVGPVGSHTTVQTWLTFVDNGGTTRYVPCF